MKALQWLLAILIIVVVLGGGYALLSSSTAPASISPIYIQPQAEYQAVFLANGQVYFGSIEDQTDHDIKLSNVYYLKVEPVENSSPDILPTGPDVELIKLGEEVHKPTDAMIIQRSNILYWEDLAIDSKIVTAIQSYQ